MKARTIPTVRFAPVLLRRAWHACGAALTELGRSTRGATAVEFAFAAVVLILLMLATVELGRFVILNQKLDRVAVSMADLVARTETISESQLADIFIAAAQVAEPFAIADAGRVIVSSIVNPDGDGAEVAWQRAGVGTLSATSRIGQEGTAATLPSGFEVREGETAIISKVFFDFEPFLSERVVQPQTVYKQAYHRPRLGTLDEIEED
jgi:Flp pilus assembly protein TadG